MSRKQIIALGGCMVASLAILFGLYAFSPLSREMYRASFTREFTSEPFVKLLATADIDVNSFYFAGATSDRIYLGNSTAPFHLLSTNLHLMDTQHVNIDIVGIDSIKNPRVFKLTVIPPYFYLTHGNVPVILRGKVGEWQAKPIMADSGDFFVEAVPMGPSSFGMRSYSLNQKAYELAKKSSDGSFNFNFDLLQKQLDGLFCVDGVMHYNKELHELVYVHYYRNEFIVADTNMNLRYRGHTIDTFSHARIKVSEIGDPNNSMLSAPPMQVNNRASVSGNYLYVQSNLLSKDEDMLKFKRSAVIDIYDVRDGSYVNSFYIENYGSEKLSSFMVFDKFLAVINEHYLLLFEINPEVLRKDIKADAALSGLRR